MTRKVGGPALGPARESRDARVIGEVMECLIAHQAVTLQPGYAAGDQGSRLDLRAEQAPGLAYSVDVLVDTAGRVNLSDETELSRDALQPGVPAFMR